MLTDDDLDRIAGKREQLEGKNQEHAGLTKDAAAEVSSTTALKKKLQSSSLNACEPEGRLSFALGAAFDRWARFNMQLGRAGECDVSRDQSKYTGKPSDAKQPHRRKL